jgi:hypothetical protein
MNWSIQRSALSAEIFFNPRMTIEGSTMLAADMTGSSSFAVQSATNSVSISIFRLAWCCSAARARA